MFGRKKESGGGPDLGPGDRNGHELFEPGRIYTGAQICQMWLVRDIREINYDMLNALTTQDLETLNNSAFYHRLTPLRNMTEILIEERSENLVGENRSSTS